MVGGEELKMAKLSARVRASDFSTEVNLVESPLCGRPGYR
jgi:hypothetical protein